MRAYTIHCCIQTSGVSEHIWKRHLTHVGRHLSVQGRETRFGRTLPHLTTRRYQTPPISVTGRSIKFTMKASKRESCTRWFSLDSVCPRQALWLLPSKDGLDRLVSPLCIEDTRISAESNQYFPNQSNISRIRPDSCVQVTFRVSADYRHSPLQRLTSLHFSQNQNYRLQSYKLQLYIIHLFQHWLSVHVFFKDEQSLDTPFI
ncbi:Hypothetical_protein [Hexamita inflata]|uniref:Hypothetical_protein n=1 Tax=Hexamita inflata TaxID=28002 RepID=A0AA86RE84_9EUKA|nr:Hypothetical protein HINF_LOCUS64011 [Hexamita inflata]